MDYKVDIYKNLRVYGTDQKDSTKSDMYLYDYINKYYESEGALRRTVRFDITLQKYPDLNTGWLISIDTDVDSACKYADGTLVVNYIKQMYAKEGVKMLQELDALQNPAPTPSPSEDENTSDEVEDEDTSSDVSE